MNSAIFNVLVTLDYELPVDGTDVMAYMVDPTDTLLDICGFYGAKVTIMAELAELWAFEYGGNSDFADHLGYDAATKVRAQLVRAVESGHDVQLHLHPQWLRAKWSGQRWDLDYSKYQLTDLEYSEMVEVLRKGKRYLEALLTPVEPGYECIGFRAGNWNTQPSEKYLRALAAAGLESDSSVIKWAHKQTAAVQFDYREAHSNVLPWFAKWDDINKPSIDLSILELPIYAEPASVLGLLGFRRLAAARKYLREDRLIAQARRQQNPRSRPPVAGTWERIQRLFTTHPKKLDFCKLSIREMMDMIDRVQRRFAAEPPPFPIPIVMIGHSKDQRSFERLGRFLEVLKRETHGAVRFSTYSEAVRTYRGVANDVIRWSLH